MKRDIAKNDEISNRIRSLRGEETFKKFSEKIKIPISSIVSVEKGHLPGPEFLIAVSNCFGVSIDWLLTGAEKCGKDIESAEQVSKIQSESEIKKSLRREIESLSDDELTDLHEYIKLIKRRRKKEDG